MKLTMEGEQRCLLSLRLSRETVMAVLLCLVAVYQGVDSRSISELLSDLEMEDETRFLPQQLTSSGAADDYEELVSVLDEPVPKRAPWAQYDVSVDSLRQKLLRSKMFNNRQKYASSNDHLSDSSSRDVFAEGYIAGWLSAKAQLFGEDQREVAGAQEKGLAGVFRRLDKREYSDRSTSSMHPVFLGMGQETANAALNTYASMLAAEEEKRKNTGDSPTNPVRFIGKRYLTDE